MKSSTCFSKKSGDPLTEYYDETSAQDSANYLKKNKGIELSPYLCSKCKRWHLSPTSRHTPSITCYDCVSGEGMPKQAYNSQKNAEQRARILYKEQGVSLNVYECDFGNGWHLTKG